MVPPKKQKYPQSSSHSLFPITLVKLADEGYFLFREICLYNGGMMNENYNAPNSSCCGRPFVYNTKPKCNYNNCCLNEYKYTMPACIRNKQPDCTAQAVIPSITVETVDGITNLANCFVHVTSTNTTYYIDDKHRPMMIWAGPMEVDLPSDVQTQDDFVAFLQTFDLRDQFLYVKYYNPEDDKNMFMQIFYDKTGKKYNSRVELEEIRENN